MAVAGEYNGPATIVGSDGDALPTLPNDPTPGPIFPTNEDVLLTKLDRQLRGVWATRVSGPNEDLSGGITGAGSAGPAGSPAAATAAKAAEGGKGADGGEEKKMPAGAAPRRGIENLL